MTSVSIAQICDAIKTTLDAATGITYAQSYNQLTDGMQDWPTIQIYPESGSMDVATNNDRTTFRGGVRQKEIVINVDLYATQRRDIGEDMAALLPLIDAIIEKLEEQDTKPYFALEGIQAFGPVAWRRVAFVYGDPEIKYVGVRFTLPVRVF